MSFRSYATATSGQTLYAHQETTTIGSVSYYLHKLSSADGNGTTLTASAAETGRKLMGRWVYPLSGVLSIPASTWTVTYRAMKSASARDVVGHCDIDILIRKSDGAVRSSIATDVANSPSLTLTNAWETLTGTYDWAAYTVVDQTDYLEVAYYIEVTTSQASKKVSLKVDDTTLALADQTKIANIMLPSEYTMEVEFTGTSNIEDWTRLVWTVDSAWTTASVSVTLQLYNYQTGQYPTSGDGYTSYTSSGTPNTDKTQSQTIASNPTYFRDAGGNWKIKVKGVKSTTTQFDFKADLVEYKTTTYVAQAPVASFTYSPADPSIYDIITFNASASYDPDGYIVSYKWDFGDGNITTVTDPIITHIYTTGNSTVTFAVTLTVTDNEGLTSSTTDAVAVINPTILHVSLPAGTYVGPNPDHWLSQCWLLNITGLSGTFTIRINNTAMGITSYDTHLIIALNNASYKYLDSLNVDTTTIPKTAFIYDVPKPYGFAVTWEEDVYPTWFSHTYIVGTIDPESYKDVNVSVTFSNATGVRMRFDAYGSTDSSPPPTSMGHVTHNPHQKDSTVLFWPPVNTRPSISGLPDLELDEDTSLDNAIDLWNCAYDAETPVEDLVFTILSVTNPEVGVTIDSNRYIDVQPTSNWYGTSEVTVQVYDGELTDTDSFNITVNPVNDPPVLAPLPDQTLDEDTTLPDAFDLDDYGSDIDGDPLTYAIMGNTNPEVGVSIDSENRIDIAPEANWYGSSIVTIQVSDGLLTDRKNFTITVNPLNDPPVAYDQSATTDEDTPISITLTAYDVDDDTLTYSVVTPPSHGTLSGTAPNLTYTPYSDYFGPDSFTFKANDGQLDSNIATVTITVNPVNDPPVLDPIGPKTVDEETELSFTATATDPDGDPLTFSLGAGAPAGAAITSGGAFSWTPTEAQGSPGEYTIRIIVSDGILEDYEDIVVTLNEVNLAPVLHPIGDKTVSEGALLQFTVTASDPDLPAQTLTYSASNLPPGATFNPTTRVFSWTPTSGQAGVYPGVHFEVSDGYLTDSEDITITVKAKPVGGHAQYVKTGTPRDNYSLVTLRIGFTLILLAAMAATITLIKRKRKVMLGKL